MRTTLFSLACVCISLLFQNYASAQSFEWASSITCPTDNTNMHAIFPDADGNVFVTGNFLDVTDFDPSLAEFNITSVGEEDIYISKLDSNGNLIWVRTFGNSQNGLERGMSIVTNAAGNVFVCGFYAGSIDFDPGSGTNTLTCSGGRDGFILKLDANGNFGWARRIGSPGSDQANSIVLDTEGNLCITGNFTNTATFDTGSGTVSLTAAGGNNTFLSKYDTDGTLLWVKNYGSQNPWSTAIDNSGHIYTTGFFSGIADFDPGEGTFNLTSAGGEDIFVNKLDEDGNFIWAVQMGGVDQDRGNGIATDATGNVVLTGLFTGIADFDPSEGANTMTLSNGSNDAFICKLDADGNLVWLNQYGATSYDEGRAVAADSYGNISASGFFRDTIDFDPGASELNLTAINSDVYITKLNSDGQFIWATAISGAGAESNRCIYTNALGDIIYVAVEFFGTIDFDSSDGEFIIADTNGASAVKLVSDGNSVNEQAILVETLPYPNPSDGNITIDLKTLHSNLSAKVRNQLGQQIMQQNFVSSRHIELSIPGAPGLYHIELLNGDEQRASFTIIKE